MTQHPSGRPVRSRIIKGHSVPRPTQEYGLVYRLWDDKPRAELVGGFGFRMPEEPDDPMYLETRAVNKRQRTN